MTELYWKIFTEKKFMLKLSVNPSGSAGVERGAVGQGPGIEQDLARGADHAEHPRGECGWVWGGRREDGDLDEFRRLGEMQAVPRLRSPSRSLLSRA